MILNTKFSECFLNLLQIENFSFNLGSLFIGASGMYCSRSDYEDAMMIMTTFVSWDHPNDDDDDEIISMIMTTFVCTDHLERPECLWRPFKSRS